MIVAVVAVVVVVAAAAAAAWGSHTHEATKSAKSTGEACLRMHLNQHVALCVHKNLKLPCFVQRAVQKRHQRLSKQAQKGSGNWCD